MLNTLVAEQAEKQARLKQLQLDKAMVQTVQSETRQTADAAVQTDFPDIMEDLKKQVASLTNIVAELTEFKAKQTLRPTPSTSSLYFSNSDTFCESLIRGIIDQEPVAAVDQCRLVPAPDKLPPAINQRPLVRAPPVTDSAVPAPDKLPPAINQRLLVSAPPVADSAVPSSDQNRFMSMPLSSTSLYPQL